MSTENNEKAVWPLVTQAMVDAADEAYMPFGDMHFAICAALSVVNTEMIAPWPEPAATVYSKLGSTCMFPSTTIRKGEKLYTAEQVREILSAHGIK